MVAKQTPSMQESTVQDSTFQLVLDQVEELVATLIEEVRERPSVVVAIGAAIVGALIGSRLAARTRRAPLPTRGAAHKARRVGDMADLAGLGLKLMQNPIVRGLVVAAVERQLRRKLPL